MFGSAGQLRPAAVAFAFGETVELQHHIDIIGQQTPRFCDAGRPRLSATTADRSSGAEAT